MAGTVSTTQAVLEATGTQGVGVRITQTAMIGSFTGRYTSRIAQVAASATTWRRFVNRVTQVVLTLTVITCASSSYVPPAATGVITLAAASAGADTGAVSLSWNTLPGFAYTLSRGLQADGSDASVIASGLTAGNFQDSGLIYHTTYYYSLLAANACGDTTGSNRASVTVNCTLPTMPIGLTAIPGPQLRQVIVRWQAIYGYTYSLFRTTVSGDEGDTPIAAGLTANVYVDDNAPRHGWAYYTLKAVNACGMSDPSAEASVRLHCCTQWTPAADCNCGWSDSPTAATAWNSGAPPNTDWTKPECS